jgi:hypothetical protein
MREDQLRARLLAYADEGGEPRRPVPNPAQLRRRGYRALAASTTAAVLLVALAVVGAGVLTGRVGGHRDSDLVGRPGPVTLPSQSATGPTSPTSPPGTPAPGTASSSSVPAVSGRLTPGSPVTPTGMGPVRFGMTLKQAERAGGVRLVGLGDTFGDCFYVVPAGWKVRAGDMAVDPVAFMVSGGRIARVDIQAGRTPTSAGVRIGSTEPQVRQAYPGRVTVGRNMYGTRLLTVGPADPAQAGYRIVFASDGQKVLYFWAGRLPEVNAQEGCA